MTVGRLLERLIGMADALGSFHECRALNQAAGTDLLLDLFDSAITFRARYQRHEDLLALTDLLVLDSANPRALAGVLRRLRTELRKLPLDEAAAAGLVGRLPGEGAGLGLDELRGLGEAQVLHKLLRICRQLDHTGRQLADELGLRFFAHAHTDDELHSI
jgi:uncharacterized alpha-E superfamily protein